MDEVATKIIDILKKHMKEPRDDIALSTALTDLKIESLDLAMIVFDIEDTFGIEIPYNANEEVEDFKTVGSVVDRVKDLMPQLRASLPAAVELNILTDRIKKTAREKSQTLREVALNVATPRSHFVATPDTRFELKRPGNAGR